MPAPDGWLAVTTCPLVVLVGVTGVGKSTALTALASSGLRYHLLPDRRFLTDQIIIAAMQVMSGEPISPVVDRRQRFAYTRRYAERYRGGMAHALARLQIDPAMHARLLVFDGLRGANEVGYALEALPLARFVVLEAPDALRVARLMGRQDPFDRIATELLEDGATDLASTLPELDEARDLFTEAQIERWMAMVTAGVISASDLRRSLDIVVEERRNYDPAAAGAVLVQLAPDRTCVIDTATQAPDAVTAQIRAFVQSTTTTEG